MEERKERKREDLGDSKKKGNKTAEPKRRREKEMENWKGRKERWSDEKKKRWRNGGKEVNRNEGMKIRRERDTKARLNRGKN